jgi:hypothetical protein
MAAQVFIDGVDVTDCALAGYSTRRLNRPSLAQVRLPMDCAIGSAGSLLKILFNGTLHHHGRVIVCETEADEDFGYTVYNSTDPMELWQWRPCRDFDGPTPGNMIDPSFLTRMVTGPQIIEQLIQASENAAGIPETAEGPLFLSMGTFEAGGVDLSGAPCTWPFSMMDMASLLTSTGELDIILTPIDSGGNMAQIDCYNGDYGTDLSGSIDFDYGQGNYNVRALRWNVDLSNVANKIQYFFGPKETIRRYKGNITGDDPCLETQFGAPAVAAMDARRAASRTAYGVRFEFQERELAEFRREQIVEGGGTCDDIDPYQMMERGLWFNESWIRAEPRTIIHVTPTRETEIMGFDIGDLVGVSATSAVRGGFSGAQRVYEYTIGWEEDGVCFLQELQTSADQEGL